MVVSTFDLPASLESLGEYLRSTGEQKYPIVKMVFVRSWMLFRVSWPLIYHVAYPCGP